MENVQFNLPGYKQSEYQLVLLPDQHLRERMIKIRKEFAANYKLTGGIPRSHLTLVTFRQIQMNEEKLINRLKTIAMGFSPFKVGIKGFGAYPSHSIYMNVTSRLPVEKLVKELKTARNLMKSGDKEPHFLQDPQFFVARRLLPWQYEQGWLEYSHRSFTSGFIADHMLLLKNTGNNLRLEVLERLEFKNLPVSIKQGDLFGHVV